MAAKNNIRPGGRKAQQQRGTPPWVLWTALGVLVLAVAGLFYLQSKQGQTATEQAQALMKHLGSKAAAAKANQLPTDGPGEKFPSLGWDHKTPEELTKAQYNSNPPTSGWHQETFPRFMVNQDPLPIWTQVHMLEHGNVLLQYNPQKATKDDIAALTNIADSYNKPYSQLTATELGENGAGVFVAPNPDMPQTIALTAAHRLLPLDKAKGNEDQTRKFVDTWLTNYLNINQP